MSGNDREGHAEPRHCATRAGAIALLHGAPAFGAVETYVVALVDGLRARGERVVLVHPDLPELTPFRELASPSVHLKPFPAELLATPAPLLVRRLARELRRLQPGLVHMTDVWSAGMLAAWMARVPRRIVTHHTPELPRCDSLFGRLLWRAAWATRPEVIYTSEADRRSGSRHGVAHVVPLGIDLERFAVPRRPGGVVGSVGRLAPQKGHRTLLEAAPLVLARRPEVRFEIVGDGELREELMKAAAPLGDRVRFLGARDDVPDRLSRYDVFALPSLYEGLCLAVIEAQAAGVPVVATPVGGVIENVVPGETGVRCEPGDARSLADGILWTLEHQGEAALLAEEARRRVRERFSKARMIDEMLKLYG